MPVNAQATSTTEAAFDTSILHWGGERVNLFGKDIVRLPVGLVVGLLLEVSVAALVGAVVGLFVGLSVELPVGLVVGLFVGLFVGLLVGLLLYGTPFELQAFVDWLLLSHLHNISASFSASAYSAISSTSKTF